MLKTIAPTNLVIASCIVLGGIIGTTSVVDGWRESQ